MGTPCRTSYRPATARLVHKNGPRFLMGFAANIFNRIKGAGRRAFDSSGFTDPGSSVGYDAVKHKGRRSTPGGRVLSEDQELRQLPRRNLTTAIRDLNRNFSIAAWMIRRHLDYVSTFHFRPKTGNPELDAQ